LRFTKKLTKLVALRIPTIAVLPQQRANNDEAAEAELTREKIRLPRRARSASGASVLFRLRRSTAAKRRGSGRWRRVHLRVAEQMATPLSMGIQSVTARPLRGRTTDLNSRGWWTTVSIPQKYVRACRTS
jgi:hypothetical protein